MGIPLYVRFCFSLASFNIVSLKLFFVCLISMCLCVFLLGFILYRTLCFLDLGGYFLSHVGKFSTIISLNIFSDTFSFSSSSGTPISWMLVCLELSQRSLRLSSIIFIILLLSNYFHHSVFQLTYSFFCLNYSAIDSF